MENSPHFKQAIKTLTRHKTYRVSYSNNHKLKGIYNKANTNKANETNNNTGGPKFSTIVANIVNIDESQKKYLEQNWLVCSFFCFIY